MPPAPQTAQSVGRLRRGLVSCGVAVPVLYFASQLVAWPFFPGYDPVRMAASDLGADGTPHPAILNTGAIFTGIAALLAAVGLAWTASTTPRPRDRGPGASHRAGRAVARSSDRLIAAAVALAGLSAINAGLRPLPDPGHDGGALSIGIFAIPVLAAMVLGRRREPTTARRYGAANLVAFVALGVILSGSTPIDEQAWQGLLQRGIAVTAFVPIAVVAWRRLAGPATSC